METPESLPGVNPESVPESPVERPKNKKGNYRGMQHGCKRTQRRGNDDAKPVPTPPPKLESDLAVMKRMKAGFKPQTNQERVWAKLFEKDPIRFNAELERLAEKKAPKSDVTSHLEWDAVSECPCCHRGPEKEWDQKGACPKCLRETDVGDPGPAFDLYKKMLAEQFAEKSA